MTVNPVALDASDANRDKTGKLTYLGGLRLPFNAKGFGGFSGLDISRDDARLIAVSDFGRRLDARLTYAKDGRLTGISNARLAPLTGLDGKPITGKGEGGRRRAGYRASLIAAGRHTGAYCPVQVPRPGPRGAGRKPQATRNRAPGGAVNC